MINVPQNISRYSRRAGQCFALLLLPVYTLYAEVALKNPSFESGLDDWHILFSQRAYPASPVRLDAAKSGNTRHALLVKVENRHSPVIIEQQLDFPAGATIHNNYGRYEVSCSVYIDNDRLTAGVNLIVTGVPSGPGYLDAAVHSDGNLQPVLIQNSRLTNQWIKKTVRFSATQPKIRVALVISGDHGQVWIDDFALKPLPVAGFPHDGLWHYDVSLLETNVTDASRLALETRQRFKTLLINSSPFTAQAKRYNEILINLAFLEDDLYRLDRAQFYIGVDSDRKLRQQLDDLFRDAEQALGAYTRLYAAKTPEALEIKIAPTLAGLEKNSAVLRQQIETEQRDCCLMAQQRHPSRRQLPPAQNQPYRMAGNGVPDQLMFGSWGKEEFRAMAPRLGIWDLLSNCGPDEPRMTPEGSFDWRPFSDYAAELKERGVSAFGVRTHFMQDPLDKNWRLIPASFAKKYGQDPQVFKSDGVLNYRNPLVQRMQQEVMADMGRQLRGQAGLLFYLYCWESHMPEEWFGVSPESAAREEDLDLTTAAFRDFLRQKYQTIANLNARWQTRYPDFSAISEPRSRMRALRYDYHCFLQETYLRMLKSAYAALKAADPDTPLMADHVFLMNGDISGAYQMNGIDPTDMFATCDILANHGPMFTWWNVYAASNAKLNRKQTGGFESYELFQEESSRWGDQRAMYAGIANYKYRAALFGQRLQFIAFPYTSQAPWIWRIGQWSQIPTDYTTLNYFAAAIPVTIRRLKSMEGILVNSRSADADLLVVFPQTTFLQGVMSRDNVQNMVNWLQRTGYTFEFRSEAEIISGRERLSDYRLIVYPDGIFLDETTVSKLLAWVKAGGTLLAMGPLGIFNPYGVNDQRFMRETMGASASVRAIGRHHDVSTWEFDWMGNRQPPDHLEHNYGQGRVVFITRPFSEFIQRQEELIYLQEMLDDQSKQAARARNKSFEFWNLIGSDGVRYLGVLNANPDQTVEDVITLIDKWSEVIDMDYPGGFPVTLKSAGNGVSFKLTLPPAGMTILRLDPEKGKI